MSNQDKKIIRKEDAALKRNGNVKPKIKAKDFDFSQFIVSREAQHELFRKKNGIK